MADLKDMHCWVQMRRHDGIDNWTAPVWVPPGEVPAPPAPHSQWIRVPALDAQSGYEFDSGGAVRAEQTPEELEAAAATLLRDMRDFGNLAKQALSITLIDDRPSTGQERRILKGLLVPVVRALAKAYDMGTAEDAPRPEWDDALQVEP